METVKCERSPNFSVIIPLYNKEKFIRDTVDSVLCQTYTDFEIIIVNDGSTDSSEKIIKSFNDPRIIIIEKPNGGVSSSRNHGINLARGKYIAFLDADDIWLSCHLKEAHEFFEKNPSIRWYTGRWKISRRDSKKIRRENLWSPKKINFFKNGFTKICSSSVVISRELVNETGLFLESLSHGEDLHYWFRVALNSPMLGYCKKITVVYIQSENSLSRNINLKKEIKLNFVLDLMAKDGKGYFKSKVFRHHINTFLIGLFYDNETEKIVKYLHKFKRFMVKRKYYCFYLSVKIHICDSMTKYKFLRLLQKMKLL